MLKKIISLFCGTSRTRSFPLIKHTFFRDANIAALIYEQGFYITDFISASEVAELKASYTQYHEKKNKTAGAFFGEISKEIHYKNTSILASVLDQWFVNYKSIVSAFVVKTPGPTSAVPIHQDNAAIDEEKFSSINVWIPLQDINETNGAMFVVPKSHHIFFPFRCATIAPFSKNIETLLAPYFIPLYLKAGQAIIFDSRMFHFSLPNLSNDTRVVAICRICPNEAKVMAYYKESNKTNNKIEIWQCPDDYLIYSESHNDTIRPKNSQFIGHKYINSSPLIVDEFEQLRKKLHIEPKAKN
jgi:hypothetical protein